MCKRQNEPLTGHGNGPMEHTIARQLLACAFPFYIAGASAAWGVLALETLGALARCFCKYATSSAT